MEENSTPLSNPWDTLPTITTFDRGNNTGTTICVDSDSSQTNGQVVSIAASSTSLLIESLIEHLCTMFESDTVRRNRLYFAICDKLHELNLIDSSYNLMEFEQLRGQYQNALYHLLTVARAATGCESTLQVPNLLMTEWSRYHREFQEISFIAAGGFGNVFKALHRLDGIEYAVKKIVVRSVRVTSIMQHLEEVKTLAKLNHTNIISYKGAWIESTLSSNFIPSLPFPSHAQGKPYRSYTSENFNIQSQSSSNSSWSSQSRKENAENSKKINSRSGQRIIEENIASKNTEKTNSNSISFRSDSKHQDHKTENSTNYIDGISDTVIVPYGLYPYAPYVNEKYVTLYIQMALCEKTLQQWLEERIELSSQTLIIGIFTQILCGLDYIHSRGIVHHDIKPSNIFISTSGDLQIQLGDFGLACPLQRENHPSVVGTHMYAAPEQLQGKCDPKSDIYSLGIVLLQLLVHTKTHMERTKIISNLRKGQIPTTLTATYPNWAHIVSQLVQVDPKTRPSTSQLLQNLNEDKDVTIAKLRNSIAEKDDTILELQERISILEAQITKYNIPLGDT